LRPGGADRALWTCRAGSARWASNASLGTPNARRVRYGVTHSEEESALRRPKAD
jgi:hypothetical protein